MNHVSSSKEKSEKQQAFRIIETQKLDIIMYGTMLDDSKIKCYSFLIMLWHFIGRKSKKRMENSRFHLICCFNS